MLQYMASVQYHPNLPTSVILQVDRFLTGCQAATLSTPQMWHYCPSSFLYRLSEVVDSLVTIYQDAGYIHSVGYSQHLGYGN